MASEQIDVFQKMKDSLEAERQDAAAFRTRHFGTPDGVQAERVAARRRAQASAAEWKAHEESVAAFRDSQSLRATLRAVWDDLESLHEPGCARVGVGCKACESQMLIRDCL